MRNPDVIVVGAGSWGLSCAYACADRGLKVVVLEHTKIGNGASGGIVGALAPHVPDQWNEKKQFQFEALREAGRFWSDVDVMSGEQSGFGRIGRVIPLQSERMQNLAMARQETSKDLWQGQFEWNVVEDHPLLAEHLAPFGVVHETLAARLFPALALRSLASACLKMGVEILEDHPVATLSNGSASGSFGEMYSRKIILAAGVGGSPLLNQVYGGITSKGVKGQAALLDVDLGSAPQIYAEGIYVIPHGKRGVAIGSTSEKEFTDSSSTDEKLDRVLETARSLCPALADAPIVQKWAGVRPKMRLPDPMLGPLPDLPNVVSALGGFKIGLGLAPKVGDSIADFVEGKEPEIPRLFSVKHHLRDGGPTPH